jgi:uncharacterized protein YjbI with pentapeptide repeats
VALAAMVAALLGWAPAASAAVQCYRSATAPTPAAGQVVMWQPPQESGFNTLVLGIGDQIAEQCIEPMQNPTVLSIAPGAALIVWGEDANTGQSDLLLPWGGLSVSQSTPINMTPEVPENWVGQAAGVSVISAKDMLEQYGTCRSCDLTGLTLKLPGYVEGPVGVFQRNVQKAHLSGSTITGNGSDYQFDGADLTRASLSADLQGATLTSAVVDRAVFAGSQLQSAALNSLVYTDPPDLSRSAIGSSPFDHCTNLGGINLLEVPYAGLIWSDAAGCTDPVFSGSSVPLGMLGPVLVTAQEKNLNLTGARVISSAKDRAVFAGANLAGVNLANVSFLGDALDLSGTHLDGATLTNTQLPLAQLAGATLTNISAAGLNLNGADLSASSTVGTPAVLSGPRTNLQSADFVGADVSGVKFVGADISNADFTRALGNNVDFTGVKATTATFAFAHLYGNGGAFDGATDLGGADFTGAVLASSVTQTGGFSLTGAPLTGAKFDQAICVACNFTGAALTDATFGSAYLPGATFTNATLTGAHFDSAWFYCGSTAETPCRNPQTSSLAWPLALGTGEGYGPVPYTATTVTGSTLVGVATCPGGGSGANGCVNQMLPAAPAPPIPAPCSASAHGSCPTTTATWWSTVGPPAASPLSLAAAAPLTWNTGLANVGYYTGYDDNTVRLVSNGAAAVFAGTANAACAQPQLPCGDGGSATNARLGVPAGLSVGVDGSLFIADSALRRLRVVAPSGVITTVAGSGAACPTTCGDGGPATAAALTAANGVAVDTHGNLYIADGSAGLRRVSPLGVISTVAAGTATGTLVSVAIGLDGTLYGAARNPDGIIAIDPGSGAVTPLVGTGTSGYNGDLDDLGGPQGGTDTQVNQPTGVSVTLDGYLAFADTGNHLVRRYNIVTQDMAEDLAGVVDDNGNPQGGTTPDGQPANATKLLSPRAVAATGTADYLITDTGNHAVRRIGPYLDDDGVGTPPPAAQKVLACRPGPTWSCRLLPAPTAAARTTVNSGVTVRRDGSTYATGPMLLAGGGGLRYLVTLERPLAPGPYTLTLRTGKHIRDLRMTLTVG